MHLKAVEIYGFKSFGERIYIEFDRGLTSIVGPNGSGKSNIMDAVLWVLGEQSYKNIRAKDSSDVIFSGNGKNSNYAEVSLIIDNSDGYFSGENSEVKITRKILKNGDNEYYINGSRSRLKDINSMFLDTGIGKSAYSVIGQGKVERIISSSNREIKGIIEEAAGIKKFQIRKQESLKNLKSLNDELEKIELVVKQVEDSKNTLEKQCKKAKEFLGIKEEKEKLQKAILSYDYNEKKERFEKLTCEEIKTVELIDKLEKSLEKNSQEFSENEYEREILVEKIEGNLTKNSELKEKIEIGEREKARAGERIESFKREQEEKERYIGKIQEKIKSHENVVSHLSQELEKYKTKLQELSSSNNKYSHEIELLEKEKRNREIEVESKKRKIMELEVERLKVVNDIENSERRAKTTRIKLQTLNEDMSAQKVKVQENSQSVKEYLEKVAESEKKVEEIFQRTTFLENKISETSMEINRLSEKTRENDYEEKRSSIKLQNIIRLEESNEGLYKGVKEVLNEKIPGVLGIVANVMNIPEGLEKAIEAAIPGNLQDIVTDSSITAKKCIELLKMKKAGRASFLALDTIKVYEQKKEFVKKEGVLGIGSQLITAEPQYKKIVDFLLGNLLIVDSVDRGLEILKKNQHSGNVVTVSGELLSARGRITGGENQNSPLSQMLERKREKQNLISLLENLREKQKEINLQQEKSKKYLEKLEGEIFHIDALEEENRKNLKGLKDELEDYQLKLEKNQRELQILESDYHEESSYIEEFQKRITQSRDSKENTDQIISKMKDEVGNQEKENIDTQEKIRVKKEEYSDIRILYLNNENRIEQLKDEVEKIVKEKLEFIRELTQEEDKRTQIILNIKKCNEKIVDIEIEIKNFTEIYERENSEINGMKLRINELSQWERKLIEERKELESNYLKNKDKHSKEIEMTERLKNELETITQELELLVNTESLEILKEEYEKIKSTFKNLEFKLKNFETVNLLAIDEFELLNKKYLDLTSQYKDMNESRKKLLSMLDEISGEIERKFREAYGEISTNFNNMCRDVLQNSEGKLLLTEGETIEDSGIDIVVRFKNKKQQSLSLFSGGEKSMVAIAFIMAIFMYKPSPFTFLDEIEAALDDKNTRKLINKLKEFTDRSQFILITHNKETMKESDTIFGVTMNKEIGISKIVPVKF
ncbi:MAG: chromosome segregation protein SMC [Fusobacteriaceae bacterium]